MYKLAVRYSEISCEIAGEIDQSNEAKRRDKRGKSGQSALIRSDRSEPLSIMQEHKNLSVLELGAPLLFVSQYLSSSEESWVIRY